MYVEQNPDDDPLYSYDDYEENEEVGRNIVIFDDLSALTLALMLIGAGGLFFIANNNRGVEGALINYSNLPWCLAIGAGILFILEVVLRVFIPRYRANPGGRLAIAVVFLAVGLAGRSGDTFLAVPVLLVGLGLVVLVARFSPKD